jgi:hypothetical protein
MTKVRRFELDDFAQHVTDRLGRLESRVQGVHVVLNGFANEIRQTDPALADRISTFISSMAVEQDISGPAREIVEIYIGILSHRFRETSELQ